MEMAPQAMVSSGPSSAAMGSQVDVPPTPEAFQAVPASPRTSPTTRQHDIAPDDHESKRARVEANCEAEHMMCIDSSSGRQLVMRQGTGKVKHVSGKICGCKMPFVTMFSSSVKFPPCGISVIWNQVLGC